MTDRVVVTGVGAYSPIGNDWAEVEANLRVRSSGIALARGAKIYAEIVGFETNSDGLHITQPSADTMRQVMQRALATAEIDAGTVGYVSAHGTATERGDIALRIRWHQHIVDFSSA